MQKRVFSSKVLVAFLLVILGLAGIAFADHTILIGGATTVNVREDLSLNYNVSILNTNNPETANVTYVNVTIPSTFTLLSDSNGTSATANFTNSTTILSWSNLDSLVINLTTHYFWFNATASTPGYYNISVTVLNVTGAYYSNITIAVNDTTSPSSVEFNSPTLANGVNLSQTSIPVNVTVADNVALSTIRIYLYNTTSFVNNTNVTSNSALFNFTSLPNAVYYLNVTANDTAGNQNTTGTGTRRIALDTVAPSISMSGTSAASSVTVSLDITDSTSGVNGSCVVNRGTVSGTNGTQTITDGSLNCETSYTYNVTCYDFTGNSANSAAAYTTQSCNAGNNEGSGSVTTSPSVITTVITSDQFAAGYETTLASNERIQLAIGTSTHYVTLISSSTTSATVEVASTPIRAIMSIGETKKFDSTGDGYYDISVTLVSLSAGKATVSVKSINEKVPSAPVVQEQPVVKKDKVVAPEEAQPIAEASEPESSGTSTILTILAIVIIIIVLLVVFRTKKKGR